MSKKIQLKQVEEGQKKSGCLGAWYHEMIRLIFKSIRKRSFLKRPIWQPLFRFCPSSLQKERICHVTICRVFRRGVLCLAGLLASQVIADFTSIDSLNLERLNDSSVAIQSDVASIESVIKAQGSDSSNYLFDRSNVNMTQVLNALNQTFQYGQIIFRGQSSKYATLRGLIGGGSWDMFGDLPMGVESNGIWYFTKDLSDALHNTNSVFHRQLTVQETLTNQMERFMALQLQAMTNLQYAVSPLFWGDEDDFTYDGYLRFYGNQFHGDYPQNYSYAYNLGQGLVSFDALHFPQSILDSSFLSQLDSNELLGYGDLWEGYGDQYYKFYGTKWGFDSITNLLNNPFDASDIAVVKPEVDDMIQDSTEEVQDSLPNTSEELESVPPGDYEEIQDERIDTDFLDEAKTDATSIKFSEHLFDDFKTSYNGIFNFRSSSSLQYSFALQSSDGVNVSVNDTDMLGNASQLLAEKKPTIDALIKIIIGLNKFICLVVLVGKAFKMVSEIFSS